MEHTDESTRAANLAQKIELLFGFCVDMIPDIELLERAYSDASGRANMAQSAAPILGALGQDFEQVSFSWELKAKRANAVVNLLKALRDTENERLKREANKGKSNLAAADLMKYFGM